MLWLFQVFLLANFSFQRLQCSMTSFRTAKLLHKAKDVDEKTIRKLAGLTDVTHMNQVLDEICIPRVVGTANHKKVQRYLSKTMNDLGWHVETDPFTSRTPFGDKDFVNIIATLNPDAERYLTLACHYDSKLIKNFTFVGATDSAVPCMQLLNLAKVMDSYLRTIKNNKLSLMLLFLDGEEAFKTWNKMDSIYGARHLASKWHKSKFLFNNKENLSELDKIDLFVLLDLIGASNPRFYNYFKNTTRWYSLLSKIEEKLNRMRLLNNYNNTERYFEDSTFELGIEDDHLPFLKRNVPILHIIPFPFPDFWHEEEDNRKNIDLSTVENLNKILRVFVSAYLNVGEHLDYQQENISLGTFFVFPQ